MQSVFFTIGLCFSLLTCFSQTFNKRFGINTDIGNTYNCSASTVVNNYIYTHVRESGELRSWVYKVNLDGDLVSAYSYGDTTGHLFPSWANYIHPFGNEQLVFSTIFRRFSDQLVFGRITVIDYDGNLIWQKNYGDSIHDHMFYQVVPTSDGGLIAVGSAVFIPSYPVFYVLKIDSEGNEQWHKYLGEGLLYRNGIWVDELTDHSGYAVSGYEDVTSYDPAGLLFILDNAGEVIDSEKYENWGNYDSQSASSILSCSNGGYIFSSEFNTQQLSQFYYRSKPQLVRIDNNLDVLWTCDLLPSWQGSGAQVVIETAEGDFVNVGSTLIRYPQETSAKYEGFISKVSGDGELLWQRFYHHAEFGDNLLYDIDELPSGGFLCTGRTNLFMPFGDSINAQSAWLLAIDEMGCLVPGCDTLGIGITEVNPVQFSIYPNPADQFINIAFSKHESMSDAIIRLYDMQGKLLKSVSITHPQATYMLDSTTLDSGTYFVKIEGKGVVATQKVMVVH